MNEHIAGEDLAAYVDGALKGEARAGIEAHLSRCSTCIETLAEIIDIQGSRVRIPEEFLQRVLGEKKIPARRMLFLRPAFGVVAALLVAVTIGYFFLPRGGKETVRIAERKMPQKAGVVRDERIEPALQPPASPAQRSQVEVVDASKKEKMHAAEEAKPAPPHAIPSGKTAELAATLKEEERLQLADEADMTRSFRSRFSSAGAVQILLTVAGRAAAPLALQAEIAPLRSRVRIEGEVTRSDLIDPGRLDGWEWFPEGPTLKLEIAADGTVVAVIPFGDWNPLAATEAEAIARKLIFIVSEKGKRHAVLSARSDPN